jgi:hypothetical protein
MTAFCGDTKLPFVVHGLYPTSEGQGKFPSSYTRPVVAEYSTFLQYIAPKLHPLIR